MTMGVGIAVTVLASTGVTGIGGDFQWSASPPASPVWSIPENWTPKGVPNSATATAIFAGTDAYTAFLDLDASLASLRIENPAAELALNAGFEFSIGQGGVFNDGTILVNAQSSGGATGFLFSEDCVLSGSGEIVLNGTGNSAFLSTAAKTTLVHEAGHTIRGGGVIAARLRNRGTILADVAFRPMLMNVEDKINEGVISSQGSGLLRIRDCSIENESGSLVCFGGGIEIRDVEVFGGTLERQSQDGAGVFFRGISKLHDVVMSGDIRVDTNATVLYHGESFTQTGELTVGPFATLRFEDSATFSSSGVIRLNGSSSATSPNAILDAAEGVWLHLSGDASLRGHGRVNVDLVNSSFVISDEVERPLSLVGDIVNNGVIRCDTSTSLWISGLVDQSGGGIIEELAGTLRVGGDVRGGLIRASDSDVGQTILSGRLEEVTLDGDFRIGSTGLTVAGTLWNPGETRGGQTLFEDGAVLAGGGVFASDIVTAPGTSMTNSEGTTIQSSVLSARIDNYGTIRALDGSITRVLGEQKFNYADILCPEDSVLFINDVVIWQQFGDGRIVADGGEVRLNEGAIVYGGTLVATDHPDTDLRVDRPARLDAARLVGDLDIRELGKLTVSAEVPRGDVAIGLELDGNITVNPGVSTSVSPARLETMGSCSIVGSGQILLARESFRSQVVGEPEDVLTLGPGIELTGIGEINADMEIQGRFEPGLGIGRLMASRPIAFASTSTFGFEIGVNGESDEFDSTSSVSLAGDLELRFADGFDATVPSVFQLLTASDGVLRRFDSISGDSPVAPLITRVVYDSSGVRVGFVCPSDANLDGVTDLEDVNAILTNFGTESSLGDLNGDGAVDLADLNIVLAGFGSDC